MEYYSYDQMICDVRRLERQYSAILECETIGYSVCKRKIIMIKLGCGQKAFFITAGIHGRESINTKLVMKLIEYYAGSYYGTDLFNKCCYYIVPMANPDGYYLAMTNQLHVDYKYNFNGVDINRNFPSKLWKREKGCGDSPGDQPETRALMLAFRSHPSLMYIDIHSRGEVIYYYRQAMDEEYNQRQLRIGRLLHQSTGYALVAPDEEVTDGDSGGNTVHYYSEEFNMPAFTIETAKEDVSFPMDLIHVEEAFIALKDLFYELAKII